MMSFISDRYRVHANKAIKLGEQAIGKPEAGGIASAIQALKEAQTGLQTYNDNHKRIGSFIRLLCGDAKKYARMTELLTSLTEAQKPAAPAPEVQQPKPAPAPAVVPPPAEVKPPVPSVLQDSQASIDKILDVIGRNEKALDQVKGMPPQRAERTIISIVDALLMSLRSQLNAIQAQRKARNEPEQSHREILVAIGAMDRLMALKEKCLDFMLTKQSKAQFEKKFDDLIRD